MVASVSRHGACFFGNFCFFNSAIISATPDAVVRHFVMCRSVPHCASNVTLVGSSFAENAWSRLRAATVRVLPFKIRRNCLKGTIKSAMAAHKARSRKAKDWIAFWRLSLEVLSLESSNLHVRWSGLQAKTAQLGAWSRITLSQS